MSPARRRAGLAALVLGLAPVTAPALARAGDDDGLYGRFEGDLDLRVGAGFAAAAKGASLSVGASAIYLGTAGLYAHYTDTLGGDGPFLHRSVAAGVVLAPIFLYRYANNDETGPAFRDLLLDSLSLQVGSFWGAPPGSDLQAQPGLELALGGSVPLFAQASGLFADLRGGVRFLGADLAAYQRTDSGFGRSAFFSLTLGWHQLVRSHLVDGGDRVPR
ncbi:MAG: hypothetical protein ABI193_25145 [Minicystis sp.]